MHGKIYALKGNADWSERIASSLAGGEGRFGWSYVATADLQRLRERIQLHGWHSLSPEEKDCYQSFLLDFKDGDYVVYINLPEWGQCTVARVIGSYEWRFEDDDFNHRFPVDPSSVTRFDRNDGIVHPALSSRLKLQGRWWQIRLPGEFEALLKSLQGSYTPSRRSPQDNLQLLSNAIQPFLSNITERIQHTHPNYDLETLIAAVFKRVPGVTEVRQQGGAGDHGADILVTFDSGLPIPGLEQRQTIAVQVKSFRGEHWDTKAVEDLERAFQHYPETSVGLIISTAQESTPQLDEAIERLRETSKKPVALLIGPDVAAFLLRFGAKLLV